MLFAYQAEEQRNRCTALQDGFATQLQMHGDTRRLVEDWAGDCSLRQASGSRCRCGTITLSTQMWSFFARVPIPHCVRRWSSFLRTQFPNQNMDGWSLALPTHRKIGFSVPTASAAANRWVTPATESSFMRSTACASRLRKFSQWMTNCATDSKPHGPSCLLSRLDGTDSCRNGWKILRMPTPIIGIRRI